jgi:hypothetical protein
VPDSLQSVRENLFTNVGRHADSGASMSGRTTHEQLVVALRFIDASIKGLMEDLLMAGPVAGGMRRGVGPHLKLSRASVGNTLSAAHRPERGSHAVR